MQAQNAQAALARGAGFRNSRAMSKLRQILSTLGAACALALPVNAQTVSIFAASSLKTALDVVVEENALDVVVVYGGSAALARQISQGAQADIVILAHPEWMDWLETQNVLAASSRCNLVGNALVLAGQSGSSDLHLESAQDLLAALADGRLAVGQMQSVPAGQYAAAFLDKKGWLSSLRRHLAETLNVRLALALIARGEVPLGFVYASDVAAEPRVKTRFVPPASDYPAIRYPMALTTSASANTDNVAQIIAHEDEVFARLGFETIPNDEAARCK